MNSIDRWKVSSIQANPSLTLIKRKQNKLKSYMRSKPNLLMNSDWFQNACEAQRWMVVWLSCYQPNQDLESSVWLERRKPKQFRIEKCNYEVVVKNVNEV